MSDETKNEFTPGPWTVDRLRIIRNGTQPTGLFNVADCADPTANQRDGNIEERIANAKLIAASPDMLAALEAIHAALNQPVHHSGTHTPETADVLRMDAAIARDMAMAAIKKAKGE